MTVISVDKDAEARTMTVTAEFEAPIERVWQLWENPRQLEQWWGPPTWPATFVDHELRVGATCTYYMTGPDGDRAHGWWRVQSVEAPRTFEIEDGFADGDGNPNPDLPTTIMRISLSEGDRRVTRMVIETTFPSRQAMEQILPMGAEEGIIAAIGQIDDILRADVSTP
jgi:uncharacterized protein YndB with AHSA1/START domain